MLPDSLEQTLFTEICKIPLIDPHTHINPHQPASKTLDDILGYHYYTELAHSAGMDKKCLLPDFDPKERVRTILSYMERFDNTVQYSWFLEIAQTFLGFEKDRVTADDCDWLWDATLKQFSRPDWEEHVLKTTNVEKIFLTNDFDDPLEGFDTGRYVPCLRVDDLVAHFGEPEVGQRLAKATGIEVVGLQSFREAVGRICQHFSESGAKACAVSLAGGFGEKFFHDDDLECSLAFLAGKQPWSNDLPDVERVREVGIMWEIAEQCRRFQLPFDLMIGVNRGIYKEGVHQGKDLFYDPSLTPMEDFLNDFLDVTFCVSMLVSYQNQQLASYSWIFPNVVTSGHWWYSNVPVYIERDLRARLQAVPKTKQIGYYSDAYKLEFILPKYNMYRRILARVLANDFVRERGWSETRAIELARLLLRDNVKRIFNV